MKRYPGNPSTTRCRLLTLVLAAAGLMVPLPSLAAVALATQPLATSTTSTVKPNLLMLLDDSGSMAWDHMPDDASDAGSAVTFSFGYYGLRSSQCNQVYYDPTITYQAPIKPDGTSYADASFTGAWTDGFSTGAGTVNLNTNFQASQSLSGDATGQSAYYYTYSGVQTTPQQRNYNTTGNTFYNECHSASGATPGSTVFSKRRLAIAETTTISVAASAAPTATITVSGGSSTNVNSITVGGTTITSGVASGNSNNSNAAASIAARITVAGYGATVGSGASSNVVTITGPPAAATIAPVVIKAAGSDIFTVVAFNNPSVSSIKVNGVELLSGTSTGSNSTSTTATNIASMITQNSYSATASGNVVTITGPASAANYTPVITSSATMTVTVGEVFPDTTAANLTNFANWYSYYRTRILMMKTATGRAFSNLNKNYRVGLMKISSSNAPTVNVDTFWNNTDTSLGPVSTQRTTWYTALYNSTAGGSTPLRTALSDAGRYYAGKLSVTDPIQYSCQQNFTLLSTDGYWNTGNGYKLDGSTAVGNQDGTAGRPMFDGAQAYTTVTTTYTRNHYSSSGSRISSGDSKCSGSNLRLWNQPEIESCSVSIIGGIAGAETCTAWNNNGSAVYVAPYDKTAGSCTSTVTVPSPFLTARAISGTPVTTPGSSGGSSDNLADIAMYYYQTDLRTAALGNCTGATTVPPTTDVCENNVFLGGTDKNLQQHMNTFTLGLGASGWMTYSSSYLNDTSGDYVDVKLGSTAHPAATPPVCPWQADGTVCNWPVPGMSGSDGLIANVDDLWHAAVNGRGAYFSATNPTTLSAGLSTALASINSKTGSAAAAATSTLNPVAGNNFAYVASYTTVAWKGNLEARGINVDTGVVDENAAWCVEDVVAQSCALPGTVVAETSGATTVYNCVTPNAVICTDGALVGTDCKVPVATACTGSMNTMVADASDTRIIKTANSTGTALINFDAAYATANAGNFDAAHISALSQLQSTSLPLLTSAQKTAAAGVNLLNYLRGQRGHEVNRTANAAVDQLYRNRETVLGDALESQPAFIGKPVFSYPYPGYSAYVTAQVGRAGTVYMGANDGMMHAFAADTGQERWAYVPSMVIPNMWKLADTSYATAHANFVNGSPITSDICTANCDIATAVWKTVLVGGLNGGGRGYYALDITVPDTPALLWEFTPAIDSDLGYSFGSPIITRKRDGTWVVLVTSGYDNGTLSSNPLVNNSPAGSGTGYLYVLNASTGAIISKISTGVGTVTTPSGLAKIAGWNDEPAGNKVGFVYGGDLLGNLWRFDVNSTVTAAVGTGDVMKLAALFSDTAGASPQAVTTTPVLGNILGKRVVFIGTGKYLETGDLATTQKQTQYAIKDDDATTTLVNPRTTLVQQFLVNNTDGTATRLASGSASSVAAGNAVNFLTGRGWFVDFPDGGSGGVGSERVNIDSKLVEGTLLVATIVPSNTVCAPGGFGWLNFFDYKTGGAITLIPGIPLASAKYDATIVGVNVLYIQGSPIVEVVTSTNPTPKKDPDVAFNATATGFTGKRVIWRELIP